MAWTADPNPLVAGYRLFYGLQSGVYQWNVNTGNVVTFLITGLFINYTYFVQCVSLDSGGNQIDSPSNESSQVAS